jgi:hypothetical protein
MADVVCAQNFFRRKGTKPILQVTVCSLCRNIDLPGGENPNKVKHHALYRDLLNSAYEGCGFCELVRTRDLSRRREYGIGGLEELGDEVVDDRERDLCCLGE